MDEKNSLVFELVDLPADGVKLRGQIAFEDLNIAEEARFFFPEKLQYDLLLAPAGGNNVLLRGKLKAEIGVVCDRCDQPGRLVLTADDVCHQYEDAYRKILDLTPDIREDILITFPQKILCREECLGLCPKCGQNLNESRCDCSGGASGPAPLQGDPWRDLDQLRLS